MPKGSKSFQETIKVEIGKTATEEELKDTKKSENNYPELDWKILQKNSYEFINLNEESFFDLIASFIK